MTKVIEITKENLDKALSMLGAKIVKKEEPVINKSAEPDDLEKAGDFDTILQKFGDRLTAIEVAIQAIPKEGIIKAEGLDADIIKAFDEKFEALAVIQKSVLDGIEVLTEAINGIEKADVDLSGIETLQKSVDDLTDTVNSIAETPMPGKSLLTTEYIKKSFGEEPKDGEKILSASTDRNTILKAFDDIVGNDIEKAQKDNPELYRAMLQFESTGNINGKILRELRDKHKIIVTQ